MRPANGLPDGWRTVRFGDVVRQVKDSVDPEASGLERYIAGEHMDTDDFRVRRWGEVGDGYLGPAFRMRFKPGHVLYGSRRTYLRKVAVADFEGICANTTFVLEPSTPELVPGFLPLVMTTEAFHAHSIEQSKGSVNPYINYRDLAWYEFPLPPVNEQVRIVEELRAATNAVWQFELVEAAASKTARAWLHHAINLDRVGETQPLGTAAACAMGRVYPSQDYTDSGMRLLRPGNIAPSGELVWAPNASVWLPDRYAAERGSVLLGAGDVVMNLTAQSLDDGFLGRVCLSRDGDESVVNQRIARLRSMVGSTEYLFRVLQHGAFRSHVAASAKGSKVKHLYWRDLASFAVPVPGALREAEVIDCVNAAEAVVRSARETTSALTLARRSLADQLLQGAFHVR